MKKCTRCGIEKELNEFSTNKSNRDNKEGHCKICKNRVHKIYDIVEDLDGEIWKDVINYEGVYRVSNFGRVKRYFYHSGNGEYVQRHRLIKNILAKNGYFNITLIKNGLKRPIGVHRLVAQAFIPNQDNKPQVNHINKDRGDNRIENLEWVTHRENISHAYNLKDTKSSFMGVGYVGHRKNKWVALIHVNGRNIKIGYFDTDIEAAKAYNDTLDEYGIDNKYRNSI